MITSIHARNTEEFFDRGLREPRRMAIFRGASAEETVRLCNLAWDQGVELVEIPFQSPDSEEALAAAIREGSRRGKAVGAGTILTSTQVNRVAELGASFCVSPGLDVAIGLACEEAGLFHLPGVATASDISLGVSQGYVWLKAFPASVLGPAWVTAMRGPFPGVKLVCTGGMSESTLEEYVAAGANAIAIGGRWAS
ncbi:MAG: bifunctional 4-hydroxy-2-oxoglutarate aldolase/2-dehydro-3-deoxy-phosphogluconate aldolase [Actinobacteria bacterium]|nr:bifunctional 4-hydroxy-2-oxoglutarate aldolase/2-dehydro-3-deoxy-phosphogluconate aldolase [Actinomycetota bacterium]